MSEDNKSDDGFDPEFVERVQSAPFGFIGDWTPEDAARFLKRTNDIFVENKNKNKQKDMTRTIVIRAEDPLPKK